MACIGRALLNAAAALAEGSFCRSQPFSRFPIRRAILNWCILEKCSSQSRARSGFKSAPARASSGSRQAHVTLEPQALPARVNCALHRSRNSVAPVCEAEQSSRAALPNDCRRPSGGFAADIRASADRRAKQGVLRHLSFVGYRRLSSVLVVVRGSSTAKSACAATAK